MRSGRTFWCSICDLLPRMCLTLGEDNGLISFVALRRVHARSPSSGAACARCVVVSGMETGELCETAGHVPAVPAGLRTNPRKPVLATVVAATVIGLVSAGLVSTSAASAPVTRCLSKPNATNTGASGKRVTSKVKALVKAEARSERQADGRANRLGGRQHRPKCECEWPVS